MKITKANAYPSGFDILISSNFSARDANKSLTKFQQKLMTCKW